MKSESNAGHEVLRTSWRDATRHCLIASFVTHKGGQGRTLGCAHVATELLGRADKSEDGRKAPRILLVDLDWSAPGLSYIQVLAGTHDAVRVRQDAQHTTNHVLRTFMDALRVDNDPKFRDLYASHGVVTGDRRRQAFQELSTLFGDAANIVGKVELTDFVGRPELFLFPALRLVELESAFEVLGLEPSLAEPTKALPSGQVTPDDPALAWAVRLLLLYLIERLELDYLLIDCQAGISSMTWLVATLISDVVFLPTTVYRQALDGTGVLVNWLRLAKAQESFGADVPYGPELVVPYISNLPLSLFDTLPDGRIGEPSHDIVRMFRGAVGESPTVTLPYVERLAEVERFVSPSRSPLAEHDARATSVDHRYSEGMRALASKCESALLDKRNRLYVLSNLARRVRERSAHGTITLRVEKGPFGEEPFARLKAHPVAEGIDIRVCAIEHDELFRAARRKGNAFDASQLENIDLVAFPHYLLGCLAAGDMLRPLNALVESKTSLVVETEWLEDYLLARETCYTSGTLYAFPFSILEKFLVVRADVDAPPKSWDGFVQWLKREHAGPYPLALENDFSRVGVWYDWLEVVAAFGGEDFRRDANARGSDYGTCWLNNQATIDGTHAYLRLFWDGLASLDDTLTWGETIDRVLSGKRQACFAWSDILNYQWPDIAGRVQLLSIPIDTPTRKRTITEGWVIGVPMSVDKSRHPAIEAFMTWFLSTDVQKAFAECGGSSSLRFDDIELPDPLQRVQASITRQQAERVVPKISFKEAPEVVAAVLEALGEMVRKSKPEQTRDMVESRLETLARHVTQAVLKNKAGFVQERPEK